MTKNLFVQKQVTKILLIVNNIKFYSIFYSLCVPTAKNCGVWGRAPYLKKSYYLKLIFCHVLRLNL